MSRPVLPDKQILFVDGLVTFEAYLTRVTSGKMFWSFIKFSHLNQFFKEIYGDQFGEFVSGYQGLRG